jgi:hypothetical protein
MVSNNTHSYKLVLNPSDAKCRKTPINIKVGGFCYDMHFHYWHNVLPLQKLS